LPFTALLTIYLSTLVGREAKVRHLVTERTAQLVALNAELSSEINERIGAQKALQTLNETLEQRVALRTAEGTRGHASVTVQDLPDYYEFCVADNGPGIAPQYHDKIFLMFQTLTVNDYDSNTGIGLALMKKIVEEHGGSIALESDEGQGATFRFSWPKHG
jgi:light-regulated signal transduction histidine kinase (bacteriophytochrome)